jgi:hypothetical protein
MKKKTTQFVESRDAGNRENPISRLFGRTNSGVYHGIFAIWSVSKHSPLSN